VSAQSSKSNRRGKHRSHLHGIAGGSSKWRSSKKDALVADAARIERAVKRRNQTQTEKP